MGLYKIACVLIGGGIGSVLRFLTVIGGATTLPRLSGRHVVCQHCRVVCHRHLVGRVQLFRLLPQPADFSAGRSAGWIHHLLLLFVGDHEPAQRRENTERPHLHRLYQLMRYHGRICWVLPGQIQSVCLKTSVTS